MPNVIEIQVRADDKASADFTKAAKKLTDTASKAGDNAGQEFSKEFADSLKAGSKDAESVGEKTGTGYGKAYVDGTNGVLRGGFGVVKQQLNDVEADSDTAGKNAGKKLADGVESGAKGANVSGSFKGEFSQIEDQADTSGRSAGKKLADGVEDGAKSGKGGIKSSFSGMGDDLKGTFLQAGQNGGEGLIDGLKGAITGKGGAIGAALGAALGIATKAATESAAREAQNANFAASMGLSPADAAVAGKAAGRVYGQGWGESMDSVMDTAAEVSTQLNVAVTDVNFEPLLKKATELSQIFGVDTTESVRAVGQMIKTGLVKDANEGFDLLAKGLQAGNDQAGDLFETFSEYPTQFRKLGLSGSDAMLLIQQGLQGGARDSDIVADSLKELSIRAVDGSKTTTDAFKSLGLNAQQTAEAFGRGGDSARTALDGILDKLRAIKDPVEQQRIGVELFGTQWEDMGLAINSLDLTPAQNQFANITGSLDTAADTATNTLSNDWERFGRGLNQIFSDPATAWDTLTTKVVNGSAHAADATTDFSGRANGSLNSVTGALQGNAQAAELTASAISRMRDTGMAGFSGLQNAASIAKGQLDRLPGDYRANLIGVDHASAIAMAVQLKLNQIKDKYVNINVGVKGPGAGFWGGFAHGGVTGHAAEGGPRSNLTWVGEQGPELVDLAPGSTVHTAGQSRNMAQGSGSSSAAVTLTVNSNGSDVSEMLLAILRKSIHAQGGNVQEVLGR